MTVRPDVSALARYGLSIADVQQTVSIALGGGTAGQIFEGVRRFDIYVRFAEPYRSDAEAIGNVLVAAPGGVQGTGTAAFSLAPNQNAGVKALNRLLKAGARASWAASPRSVTRNPSAGARRVEIRRLR